MDIQRFPKGLIDLLGMRATGDTPHQLAQQTIPTLEVTDYYLSDRVVGLSVQPAGPLAATGFVSAVNSAVPAGEQWLVYSAAMILPAIAAATAIKTALVIRRAFAAYQVLAATGQVPAGEGFIGGITFERPMIMRSGDDLGFFTTNLTGVPASTPTAYLAYGRILV